MMPQSPAVRGEICKWRRLLTPRRRGESMTPMRPRRPASPPALVLAFILIHVAPASAGTPAVTVVATPGSGQVPDAEATSDGVVHLAYVSGEDVFYTLTTDGGKSFAPAIRVNSDPGTAHPPNSFRGPDVAVGADGTVHVIWYVNAYQRKRPEHEWGVHYARRKAGAAGFEPARNLNGNPSDGYSLAVGPKNEVGVFWLADGLFLSFSRNGGESFDPPVKVPGADTCECCATRTTFADNGSLVCAYRDKAGNRRDMKLAIRKPAAAFTLEPLSNRPWQIPACPMTGCSLMSMNGSLLAAWQTDGAVSFAALESTGSSRPPAEAPTGSRSGRYPVAVAAPNGTVCVSWKEDDSLKWRLFSKDSRPLGDASARAAANPHRHAAAAVGSSFLLVD